MTGMRRAVLVGAGWIAAAAAFGVVVSLWRGGGAGQEYFAAYLIEKALSIDNVFVFALVFQAFAVPAAYQHRVLFAGVLGALVMRAGFISAGATLLEHLSWAGYVFGALLVAAALRMARGGAVGDPRRGLVMRGLRKVMPVTESFDGGRFLTRREGRLFATPLLAVLILIETMDVIFAIDSIPAALGVTTDVFIVVTSNVFAVLGLRALYFVLAGAMERFAFLSTGLAVMLAFIGVKMLLAGVVHIPVAVSLGVIIVVIACAVLLSVRQQRRRGAAARPAGAHTAAGHETGAWAVWIVKGLQSRGFRGGQHGDCDRGWCLRRRGTDLAASGSPDARTGGRRAAGSRRGRRVLRRHQRGHGGQAYRRWRRPEDGHRGGDLAPVPAGTPAGVPPRWPAAVSQRSESRQRALSRL